VGTRPLRSASRPIPNFFFFSAPKTWPEKNLRSGRPAHDLAHPRRRSNQRPPPLKPSKNPSCPERKEGPARPTGRPTSSNRGLRPRQAPGRNLWSSRRENAAFRKVFRVSLDSFFAPHETCQPPQPARAVVDPERQPLPIGAAAKDWGCEVVANFFFSRRPHNGRKLASPGPRRKNRGMSSKKTACLFSRIDPVLEPIGFGFAASLGPLFWKAARRLSPKTEMMMGWEPKRTDRLLIPPHQRALLLGDLPGNIASAACSPPRKIKLVRAVAFAKTRIPWGPPPGPLRPVQNEQVFFWPTRLEPGLACFAILSCACAPGEKPLRELSRESGPTPANCPPVSRKVAAEVMSMNDKM